MEAQLNNNINNVKRNVWIGAGVTVLPSGTIGENVVVAADTFVGKDVLDNNVVGGFLAKILRTI